MKKNQLQTLVLVLMFSFISNLFAQKKGFEKVTKIADRLVKRHKVPGLAITVAHNGKTVYAKGFGFADIENKTPVNTDETIFRIGSVSKPITATALAKLVQEHKVDVNASLYKYLPNYPKAAADFTLKQLGGHLAGLRNYKGNEFMNNKPLTIAEGVDLFKNDTLLFTPNSNYAYTTYSFSLLSLALQTAMDKPFEKIVQDVVLSPLKMDHTFADAQQYLPNKATFYQHKSKRKFEQVSTVHNYFKLAGGGYLSTSDDITKLGNALLDANFIKDDVLKAFVASQKVNGKLTYYGIGFQASYDHKNRPYFGHIGNGLGGYGIFYVYPKEKIVITILTNCSNPMQDKKFNKMIDAVFNKIAKTN